MPQYRILKLAALAALLLLSSFAHPPRVDARAQTGQSLQEMKEKAFALSEDQKFMEALPMLEKIAAADPDDAATQFYLGFALIAKANATKGDDERKAIRVRARQAFVNAKRLGLEEPLVDALIQNMPPDGSEGGAMSGNAEADALMKEAESHFAQNKYDEALAIYQKALQLDPKLYEAALFSGDVYLKLGDFAQAEVWYQKAIAIDPTRETAYRYSATPLMRQKKYDQARDRYVEAFISEPYSRFSVSGLTQWAEATDTTLAHPKIDVPAEVSYDEKGDLKIDLDASVLLGGKEDGSFAWLAYGTTRKSWRDSKFAAKHPNEKQYRRSLAEEADALRSVVALASGDKEVKRLSPSIARLKKLDDEGLLEAYILMARADQGIAMDHPEYLRSNRDKLRRYVFEYVLTGGGK